MKKVSVVLALLTPTPFLRAMTEFAIKTLRMHADHDFELVVVEAAGRHFDPELNGLSETFLDPLMEIDQYLNFTPKIGAVRELNKGLEAATGDYIVCTGNDVIVPPHWDTELLRCFEERKDCGVASLSAFEPGAVIGPSHALDMLVEGMYSPFMMFRNGERMDEAYRKIYQDSDFVLRLYERGYRAYRSCRSHVHHLLRMTSDRVEPEAHNADLAHDERLFYQRWGKSPLAMFGMIRRSHLIYGREHESFLNPIVLHHDPYAPA